MNKLNINKINIFLQLSFFVAIFTTASQGCYCLRSKSTVGQSDDGTLKESFCNRSDNNHLSVAPTQCFMPNKGPILTILADNNFDIDSSQFNLLKTFMIERPGNSAIAIQSIPVSKIEWENLKGKLYC